MKNRLNCYFFVHFLTFSFIAFTCYSKPTTSAPTPSPVTPAPTATPGDVGYVLLSGATEASCPPGREVPQEDCLAAANGLTASMTTITNRDELYVNDWNGKTS